MKKALCGMILASTLTLGMAAPETSGSEIKSTAQSLDELISQQPKTGFVTHKGHRQERIFKPADPAAFYPALSVMLQMDQGEVKSALRKTNYKLSDLIFARLIAAKTETPVEQTLKSQSTEAWLRQLQERQVPIESAQSVFNNIYVELAFLALDAKL
jgi:hypothetical protein